MKPLTKLFKRKKTPARKWLEEVEFDPKFWDKPARSRRKK